MPREESSIIRNLPQGKSQKYLLGVFAAVFFILIYLLNVQYPLWGDDWKYSYIDTINFEPIGSFSDIIKSQYIHYFEWGGRSVVHVIAQLLLWMDIRVAHFLNSLACLLFVYLIYKYANKGKSVNAYLFLFVASLTFVAQLSFTNTAIWITGSANYLWGTLIIIAFMYPYYSYCLTQKANDTALKCLLFLLFGIVAGWTNENTSLAMIFVLIASGVYLKVVNIPIPRWCIFGIAGTIIGCLFMIMAPGNFVRSQYLVEVLGFNDMSFFQILVYKAPRMLSRYLVAMLLLAVAYLLVFRFCIRRYIFNSETKTKIGFSILLFAAAHLGFLAMIAAPSFPTRATFGVVTFLIISLSIVFAESEFSFNRMRFLNKMNILILFVVLALAFYGRRYYYIGVYSEKVKEREVFMDEQKARGVEDIVFPTNIVLPKDFAFYDISEISTDWINGVYAHYYGVKSVCIVSHNEEDK